MKKTPRDYQLKFVKETSIKLRDKGQIIAQSPTGSGKTFMMFMMIESGLKKGKTFLVLSESKKIFRQLVNEFNAKRIHAGADKNMIIRENNCYVAMSQTIKGRKKTIEQFQSLGENLIIFADEAHIGTHTKVLRMFEGFKIVGFTATPDYRQAKFLPEIYKDIVLGLQVEDLIAKGALCPYKHIGRHRIDEGDLTVKSGEFTEKSQEIAFGKSNVYEGLYEDLKTIEYTKGIVFVASIKHAEETHRLLNENGYKSSIFHSERPDAEQQLDSFHNDKDIKLCVTVATLTKGYDFPAIDLTVLYRSTKSLPLYLQMIGRGGRVLEGKKFHTCLDYGENYKRFGGWDANRDWEKLWQKIDKEAEQPAPMKECGNDLCSCYVHASVMVCPWCGYEFPVKVKEMKQGDLVDFKSEISHIIGENIGNLTAKDLAIYSKTKNRPKEAIMIAKCIRFFEKKRHLYYVRFENKSYPEQTQNFLRDFGAEMNYKPNWYAVQTGEIDKNLRLGSEMNFRNYIIS